MVEYLKVHVNLTTLNWQRLKVDFLENYIELNMFLVSWLIRDRKTFCYTEKWYWTLDLKNQLLFVARRYIYLGRCRESSFSVRAFNILVKDTITRTHNCKTKGEAGSPLSKIEYCYAKNVVFIYLVVNYMYAMQCQLDSIKWNHFSISILQTCHHLYQSYSVAFIVLFLCFVSNKFYCSQLAK